MPNRNACSVDDCDRPAQVRGWCRSHYSRWRRHGDPGPAGFAPTKIPERGPCSADGCRELAFAKGLCKAHYQRLLDKGDPGTEPIHEKRPGQACERAECADPIYAHYLCRLHYRQTIFSKGYLATHRAVSAARGRAAEHRCIACQNVAAEWAYQYSDPNAEHTPNGMAYSRDVTHYAPMCSPCHHQFDAVHRKAG